MTDQTFIPSINFTRPAFPCNVISFSKQPGNEAFDIFRFDSQEQFDHYRVGTVAAVRVIRAAEHMKDVPIATLMAIFQSSQPARLLSGADRLDALVFDILPDIAIPYGERIMSTSAAPAPTNSTEA